MDLRDKIAEKLMRACAHLDDDPECAEMTADAVMRDVVTPELERLTEERDAARLVSKGRTMGQYDQEAELERLRKELTDLRAHRGTLMEALEAENNLRVRAEVERDAQIQRAETAEREITRIEGFCRDQRQRAEQAEVERDALKAATERVRAVCAGGSAGYTQRTVRVVDVHRALDTPTPTEEGS